MDAPAPADTDEPVAVAVRLRDEAILELLYGSGLRVSEVTTLTTEGLDLDGGRVHVVGRGSRSVACPCPRTRSSRSERGSRRSALLATQPTEALFVNRKRKPMSPATFEPWWTVMLVTCCRGVESGHTRCGTHSRHTCWKGGPTSARFRNCWGIAASPRRSGIRMSRGRGCSKRMSVPTRGPDR